MQSFLNVTLINQCTVIICLVTINLADYKAYSILSKPCKTLMLEKYLIMLYKELKTF